MLKIIAVAGLAMLPVTAWAQQQVPVGGAGNAGGPYGDGITAPHLGGAGLGKGKYRPATPTGTATATGLNDAGGIPNGPNSPSTDTGNAGAGGGVSPAAQ